MRDGTAQYADALRERIEAMAIMTDAQADEAEHQEYLARIKAIADAYWAPGMEERRLAASRGESPPGILWGNGHLPLCSQIPGECDCGGV